MNKNTNMNNANEMTTPAINVGAVLDENGLCIGQDTFPLSVETFINLYNKAVEADEIYQVNNPGEIFDNALSEVELFAIKHDGKTIIFNYEEVA